MKVTFINEMADLCEKVGADVHDVARGIGLDGRIGRKFLHPGPRLRRIVFSQGHAGAFSHARHRITARLPASWRPRCWSTMPAESSMQRCRAGVRRCVAVSVRRQNHRRPRPAPLNRGPDGIARSCAIDCRSCRDWSETASLIRRLRSRRRWIRRSRCSRAASPDAAALWTRRPALERLGCTITRDGTSFARCLPRSLRKYHARSRADRSAQRLGPICHTATSRL